MIRTSMAFGVKTLTVRNLNAYDPLISSGPHIQCVRWKRKPIWLPTAKTKMFRIPERPYTPPEELEELRRLYNNYRTLMKSMMKFFIEKEASRMVTVDESAIQKKIEHDFEVCSAVNQIWNKQVAALRRERLQKERQEREKEIAMKLEMKRERDMRLQEQVDAEIRKAKAEAVNFITAENVDEVILSVLDNITNHNAAIDWNGNYYRE